MTIAFQCGNALRRFFDIALRREIQIVYVVIDQCGNHFRWPDNLNPGERA